MNAEVHAVFDRLALEQHHGDLLHEVAGVRGIPEVDRLDRAALQILTRDRRQAGADHAGLVLQTALLDGEADAGDVGRRATLEALEVRVFAQQLLRLCVGLLLVVVGLVAVADQLHLRVLFLLPGDGAVDPFVMRLRGQAADEHGVLALALHAVGEQVHLVLAVVDVLEGFQIPVGVLDVRSLVGDDLDAGGARLFEHRLERFRRERHDRDRIGFLGDHVLDQLDLKLRVGLGRPDFIAVVPGVGRELLHAGVHPVEPLNSGDLDDRGDVVRPCRPRRRRRRPWLSTNDRGGGRRQQFPHVFLPSLPATNEPFVRRWISRRPLLRRRH